MKRLIASLTGLLALAAAGSAGAQAPRRIYSLDQCADQYVLALAPRARIAALSPRADDSDSHLRALARGLPQGRAATEPILARRADAVVRYWGGDPLLLSALERRGVRVIHVEDASDFEGVRRNVRVVAKALGAAPKGEALIERMEARLMAAARAPQRRALYLTSGGFTAGPDTLIGAMLRAAQLINVSPRPGFQPVSLERLVLAPPQALVLGYFDAASLNAQRWAFGRHAQVRKLARTRPAAAAPASVLGCPAWFAADGAAGLAGRLSR